VAACTGVLINSPLPITEPVTTIPGPIEASIGQKAVRDRLPAAESSACDEVIRCPT
jgi:hypothetical protein